MELILYKVGEPKVINKVMTDAMTVEIRLKGDVDVIQPLIPLARGEVDYRFYNYAHIPELGRYYFITDIEVAGAKIVNLQLECDVIETYKDDILASYAKYKRGIEVGDYTGSINTTVNKTIEKYSSDVTLSDSSIILTTIGD